MTGLTNAQLVETEFLEYNRIAYLSTSAVYEMLEWVEEICGNDNVALNWLAIQFDEFFDVVYWITIAISEQEVDRELSARPCLYVLRDRVRRWGRVAVVVLVLV
jgi:hypothetical protein